LQQSEKILDPTDFSPLITQSDGAAMNTARDKAMSDYSALLAADAELAKAATDLAAAAAGNAAFYGGATTGNGQSTIWGLRILLPLPTCCR
jgi:hypothetical protein